MLKRGFIQFTEFWVNKGAVVTKKKDGITISEVLKWSPAFKAWILAAIWAAVELGLPRAVSVGGVTPDEIGERVQTQGLSAEGFDEAIRRNAGRLRRCCSWRGAERARQSQGAGNGRPPAGHADKRARLREPQRPPRPVVPRRARPVPRARIRAARGVAQLSGRPRGRAPGAHRASPGVMLAPVHDPYRAAAHPVPMPARAGSTARAAGT